MKKIISIITVIAIACTLLYAFATPGTNDDPLVSLSYITDTLIPEIHKYVDEKIANITSSGSSSDASDTFNVVDVKQGQIVKAGKGCEMILRMGSGTIIASQSGGLSDVTQGYDLANGENMPANHLLICPLEDGRGIKVTKDGKIMIKGKYSIE